MLVVDTASRTEALALAAGDWVVGVLGCRTRKGHSAILLPAIDQELRRQGWRVTDIDAFGVVLGPGSFTGIRVGIATVLGLSRAAGKPVVGYDSLRVRAMALGDAAAPVVPILDARKGEVYAAAYDPTGDFHERIAPGAMAPDELAESLAREIPRGPLLALGGGARLYADRFRERLGDRFHIAHGVGDVPGVAAMAVDLAARVASGDIPADEELAPLYLRSSQAER